MIHYIYIYIYYGIIHTYIDKKNKFVKFIISNIFEIFYIYVMGVDNTGDVKKNIYYVKKYDCVKNIRRKMTFFRYFIFI